MNYLAELAAGNIAIHYNGAEEGNWLDERLMEADFGINFDICESIDEDTAERYPYYYINGKTPDLSSDIESALRAVGKDALIMEFHEFKESLYHEQDEALPEEIDLESII